MWRCPLCQHPLSQPHPSQQQRSWECPNRHTFDEAKSGYLHLLPVQQKKSKHPGDDKTMVNARRRFHDAKGYAPLMAALVEQIKQQVNTNRPVHLYDAGCGEGSYLGFIANALTGEGYNVEAAGSDIAKHAVDIAAKRYKACRFAVASSVKLPLEDASQHVVLQVFAPGNDAEYQRIIASGGLLITVDPAANHLWAIKQAIYDNPRQHDVQFNDKPGFAKLASERISFTVALEQPDIRQALLEMTPYYWRLPKDKADATFAGINSVEADFAVHIWQRSER
ncbi:putative RNA methyltransferase [Alteromonas gilva]|uniref:Methyltransferase domain-containing protein n=1 Tax=Alteromonas gilva TaxID=2987522 RepID=A0ABT5L0R8_9ALTE|nr:methyltransferase [Alteromonas gilva]MDC8830620.1 methyltransferase domain-containing protein [Alteromonas gilva]